MSEMKKMYAAVGAFALAAGATGQVVTLDDFDTGFGFGDGVSANDDAGGDREIATTIVSDQLGLGGMAAFTGVSSNEALVFASGPGVVANLVVGYDPASPLALVQSSGQLEFDFTNVDLAFEFVVALTDVSGFAASKTVSVSPTGGMSMVAAIFGEFTADAGFDFGNVAGVTLTFNTGDTADLDFVLSEIRGNAVPTPGAVSLAVFGAVLSFRRRR